MRERALGIADWTLLAGGFAIQIFYVLKGVWGDGSYRLGYLTQLLSNHTLNNFQFSYAGPIWALPLAAIDVANKDPQFWWTSRYNVMVLAAGMGVLWWCLRNTVPRATLRAFFVLLLGASMFPFHIGTFYGETFTAVMVGAGLVLRQRTRWAWVMIGLGVMNTPATGAPLALVAVYLAWKEKRLLPLIATAATACGVLLENWIRRGTFFDSGYPMDNTFPVQVMPTLGKWGWSYPFLFGLLSLLFSFGRGIAFYAPGLWLSFFKRDSKSEPWMPLWLLFTAGLVLIYAKWWAWHGAAYWGPRFHLFAALPATWLLAHFATREKDEKLHPLITLFFLAVSVWVSIDGVAFNYFKGLDRLPACTSIADGVLCLYTPEFSPLFYPYLHMPELPFGDKLHIAFCLVVFARYAVPLVAELARRTKAVLPPWASFAPKAWRI